MGVRNGPIPCDGSAAGEATPELVPGPDEKQPPGGGTVAKGRCWMVESVDTGRADICTDLRFECAGFWTVEGAPVATADGEVLRVESGCK